MIHFLAVEITGLLISLRELIERKLTYSKHASPRLENRCNAFKKSDIMSHQTNTSIDSSEEEDDRSWQRLLHQSSNPLEGWTWSDYIYIYIHVYALLLATPIF